MVGGRSVEHPPPDTSGTTVVFACAWPFRVFLDFNYEDTAGNPGMEVLAMSLIPPLGQAPGRGALCGPCWAHCCLPSPASLSPAASASGLGWRPGKLFDLLQRKAPSTQLKMPIYSAICPRYGLKLMVSIADTQFQPK